MAGAAAFPDDDDLNKQPDPENERTEYGEITCFLHRMQAGDLSCREEAFRAVYFQLRRLAAAYMRDEGNTPSLQPTALVHEAYLKLLRYKGQIQNRQHFLALAAEAMRRILVDHARARRAARRGVRAPDQLDESTPALASTDQPERVLSVNSALERLEASDARKGQIVVMKYFGGYNEQEIAEALGVHVRTIRREWTLAKAWLYAELT